MSVTVSPSEFSYVAFDAAEIARIGESLRELLGLDGVAVRVEVDETTPLARVSSHLDGETVVIHAESGALEDTRRPRQQSEAATVTTLGRMLLRARDRLQGGFGEAPPDRDLSLAQVAAWDAYCAGRLARLGIAVNEQRWRYNFRNRLGFSDDVDATFDRIYASDTLTWGQLAAMTGSA